MKGSRFGVMEHGVIEVECLSGTCLQLLKKYHIHVHVPYVCMCVQTYIYHIHTHVLCSGTYTAVHTGIHEKWYGYPVPSVPSIKN